MVELMADLTEPRSPELNSILFVTMFVLCLISNRDWDTRNNRSVTSRNAPGLSSVTSSSRLIYSSFNPMTNPYCSASATNCINSLTSFGFMMESSCDNSNRMASRSLSISLERRAISIIKSIVITPSSHCFDTY